MNTKLTLTIEQTIIERAKKYESKYQRKNGFHNHLPLETLKAFFFTSLYV